MPRKRDREPRFVPVTPRKLDAGQLVHMGALLGRVLATLRRRLDVSQAALAEHLFWPQSLQSKIERGDLSVSVDQLDALAGALSVFEERRLGQQAQGWRAWELLRLTQELGDALQAQGLVLVWPGGASTDERDPRFLQDPALSEAVLAAWPEAWRGRL